MKLFKETNVDGVSIASMFHYKYIKKDNKSNTIGTNYFLKNFDEKNFSGILIKDLKKYLADNKINIGLKKKPKIAIIGRDFKSEERKICSRGI